MRKIAAILAITFLISISPKINASLDVSEEERCINRIYKFTFTSFREQFRCSKDVTGTPLSGQIIVGYIFNHKGANCVSAEFFFEDLAGSTCSILQGFKEDEKCTMEGIFNRNSNSVFINLENQTLLLTPALDLFFNATHAIFYYEEGINKPVFMVIYDILGNDIFMCENETKKR